MSKQIGDRYYITNDLLLANCVILIWDGNDYQLNNLTDADIEVWDEESQESYPIKYAEDISKKDSMHGKPYYTKE